jgi:hypothetical protein
MLGTTSGRGAGAMAGLMALFQTSAGRLTFPALRWRFDDAGGTITLTLTSDLSPQAVRTWIAGAPTQDFRAATWAASAMTPQAHGYVYARHKRPDGAVALFGEAVYGTGVGSFSLSTTVRIFP